MIGNNGSGTRTIIAGVQSTDLCNNFVSTRKYTWFSFLPVSLLFQFRSLSNSYFLLTATIMLIPGVSPISPYSAITPLCFVLFVSEVREFFEEYQKYKRDLQTNQEVITRLAKTGEGAEPVVSFEQTTWGSLHPGDLVVLRDRDKIPADIVLLSSGSGNCSYVETSNLDGETNLKSKEAPKVFESASSLLKEGCSGDKAEDYDFSKLFGQKFSFEAPNPDMYRFRGSLAQDSTTLTVGNMMLRGCSMRNTPWAVGVCVYTGHETKSMLNSASEGVTPSKKTNVERRMNVMVLVVFVCQLLLILGATLGYTAVDPEVSSYWYLSGLESYSAGFTALTFFVLLNTIIPVSLWVSLEILKFLQAALMEQDQVMKDGGRKLGCVAHSKNLNEELGQVTHVFTDKTGTLTCNRMEFKGCCIGGTLFTCDGEEEDGLTATRMMTQFKRRDLGFAGAIPIGDALLQKILTHQDGGGGDDNGSAVMSEFFKCIALCHSCERVKRNNINQLTSSSADEKQSRGNAGVAPPGLFGWFSKLKKTEKITSSSSAQKQQDPAPPVDRGVSTVYPPAVRRVSPNSAEAAIQDEILSRYIYQSTSPDEAALVSSAADVGFIFHKRLPGSVQLDISGTAYIFDILHQIAFTSDRRMMSVVVMARGGSSVVTVYTKGADSSVIPRCVSDSSRMVEKTTQQAVERFSEKGLRTLCLAKRDIPLAEWRETEARIKKASENIDTREAAVAKIDYEIESGLTLLGCTAVEDKLQPGVHETVAALRCAGISVTMITGDKRETAINIARSCGLVNSEHNVYTMSTQDNMYGGGNFIHLDSLAQMVGDGRADPLWGMTSEGQDVPIIPRRDSVWTSGISAHEQVAPVVVSSLSPLASEARIAAIAGRRSGTSVIGNNQTRSCASSKFCIVLDGAALSILLANPGQTKKLLSVMAHPQCEAAVFCRVNPKQKGLIVKSCRDRLSGGCVLAIGDGANDISMIKEAHVGIGIFGEEGWQAAGSADYAITRFKDVYRLLFVHGRLNYLRITLFICFFMYKNYAFTFLQFWMATFSAWSGVSVLDSFCLLAFNSVFMVGPLFAAGLFDKDISPDQDRPSNGAQSSIAHPPASNDSKWYVQIIPKLYNAGQRNDLFKSKRVVTWLFMGLVHSVVIFFGVMLSWALNSSSAIDKNGFNASFSMDSQAIYTVLLLSLSGLHHLFVKEWNAFYFACTLIFHLFLYLVFVLVYNQLYIQPYGYIAQSTFSNWNFWFTLGIIFLGCAVPISLLKYTKRLVKPALIDAILSKRIPRLDKKRSKASRNIPESPATCELTGF